LLGTASAVAILSGCTETVPSGDHPDPSEASNVKGYEAFWLGQRFDGHRLTDVTLPPESGSSSGPEIGYGTCEIESKPFSTSDAGCALPLSVRSQSVCDEFWKKFPAGHRPRLERLRGALAARLTKGQAYVYTGRTTITIFAPPRLLGPALRSVRPIGGPGQPRELQPPVRGSLTRQLPCQTKRV
jgi:hypothetical protein